MIWKKRFKHLLTQFSNLKDFLISFNNAIVIIISVFAVLSILWISHMGNMLYTVIKNDKDFGQNCSILIRQNGYDESHIDVVQNYTGKNSKHFCEETYDLQKEYFLPYYPEIEVVLQGKPETDYEQSCERFYPIKKVTITVTSNDKTSGGYVCEGIMK